MRTRSPDGALVHFEVTDMGVDIVGLPPLSFSMVETGPEWDRWIMDDMQGRRENQGSEREVGWWQSHTNGDQRERALEWIVNWRGVLRLRQSDP